MRRILTQFLAYAMTIWAMTSVAWPQERGGEVPGSQHLVGIKDRLREEAAKLTRVGIVASIPGQGDAADKEINPAAAELANPLDKIMGEILAVWLTRGLDDDPAPSDLADRIARKGVDFRKSVVEHARAIAVQTIRESHQSPSGREIGADRKGDEAGQEVGKSVIRDNLDKLDRGKLSFRLVVLGRQDIKKLIGVTPQQDDLAWRLDSVVRNLLMSWLERSLVADLPARELVDRATRQREVVVGHAETILRLAILTPDQAERFERAYWATLGWPALLDDRLASRLGLSKEQRSLIAEILANKDRVAEEMDRSIGWLRMHTRTPEEAERAKSVDKLIRSRISEAEQDIWDVLNPGQVSKLGRLVGKALQPPLPDRAKRPRKSSRPN